MPPVVLLTGAGASDDSGGLSKASLSIVTAFRWSVKIGGGDVGDEDKERSAATKIP
jgi:hypothetical protein